MVKVAVVGAGYGAYGLAPAFQRAGAAVVGLVAPSPNRRDRAAARLGIPYTAPDLPALYRLTPFDAIAIAVPPDRQGVIAGWALERRLAVFAEKPLGATLAEAETLADLAEQTGAANAIDFLFPELPAWRAARELLRTAAIGDLREASVSWRFQSYDHHHGLKGWKTDAGRGGGALRHFGSHTLYYLEWLCGAPTRLAGEATLMADADGDTRVTFHGQTTAGAAVSAIICNDDPAGDGHTIRLTGTTGALILANRVPNPVAFTLELERPGHATSRPNLPVDPPLPAGTDPRVGPISRIAARFLAATAGGGPVIPSFADGLRIQRYIEAFARVRHRG